MTVDAQTVQSGTAEKVGLFLQSVSYFVATFIVGFILNARLTGILLAAVIPTMALVVITGTLVLNRYSKRASDNTTTAASVAGGAIKAVQVVQAFDAFGPLVTEHKNNLAKAMGSGVKKSIAGAVLLGSVFFIALVLANSLGIIIANALTIDSPQMLWLSLKDHGFYGADQLLEMLAQSTQLFFLSLMPPLSLVKPARLFSHLHKQLMLGGGY